MDVCNLLVIDDDPNIRNLLNELLAGRQDILLFSAGSGPEAVKHFAANRVDVVLTDIHMPGFTGLELMADMKKINFKPEILVMTANATPESVETSRKLGARSVILKPFDDLEVIEAEINKAVAAVRAARGRGHVAGVTERAAQSRASAQPAAASPAPARPAPAAAAKPAPAPAAAAAPRAAAGDAPGLPESGPLPDFDAWNGELTGNDTPVVLPPPAAGRSAPAPIAVAPAPAASLRPASGQGLRAVPKPALAEPAAQTLPKSPAAQPAPAPARATAPAVPTPAATAPPQVAETRAGHPPRIVEAPHPPAAPRAAVASPSPAQRSVAAPPSPGGRTTQAAAAHSAPAHAAHPQAVPAHAPHPPVAAAHAAGAHHEPARGPAAADAPPHEEAVPDIPAPLESIFRTATRFDTGKLRMQVPIICLQTWEEKGAIAALRPLAMSLQREFYVWSVGKGLVKENGQSMGDIYREPGRALEFMRRHKSNGLYVLADFRPWLEDKAVVRLLREMVMELETARSMLVLTAPRLPAPPELQPVCASFDWPAGGPADPQALYEEVAEEVAAATGLGLDLSGADREALLDQIKDMPAGRARFEIARALMARAR